MKRNAFKDKTHHRMLAIILIISMLLCLVQASAVDIDTDNTNALGFVRADLTEILVSQDNEKLVFNGKINDTEFTLTGKAYGLYDNINSNKIFVIECNPDPCADIHVANLEFEINAKAENLEVDNLNLAGKDVVRIAIYIEGEIYYVEQEITISPLVTNNILYISEEEDNSILETIISNSTWYTRLDTARKLSTEASNSTISTWAQPTFDEELEAVDISTINKIGRMNFTKEQFVCYWDTLNADYGYMIDCIEWPTNSGNILVSCLYYDIVINRPGSGSGDDTALQLMLITDRQYRYIKSLNTIVPFFNGTDYRIYDVKLALGCSQYLEGNGYDYIYERHISAIGGDNTNIVATIAQGFIQCFDKYGVISYTQDIFTALGNATPTGTSTTCVWEADYDRHYASFANNKEVNTIVRSTRADTDGHILANPNDCVLLRIKVKDRDYEDNTTDVSMLKGLNYTISFELRRKNGVIVWLAGGDLIDVLELKGYTIYTR